LVREELYGITTVPATVFDGDTIVQEENPEQYYSVFRNWITKRKSIPPKLRLHLETSLVSSAEAVNVKLHIVSIDSIEDSEYRLFYILYEDSVYFKLTGAPDSIFYFVVRKMIPDEQGALIDLFYPDSVVYEVYFNLQSNWNIENLGLIAFVQDMETKQVLQAIVDKRIAFD
jgi:hypothetical protein